MNPRITVIVTTSNRQELLRETLNAVLAQTYTDFELIVVDNYSNYDFPEFIKSFKDTRIKGYQNFDERVISINRNFGITLSKAEFIAFCDDDDVWESTKLQEQVKIMDQYQKIDLCCTASSFIINGIKMSNRNFSAFLLRLVLSANFIHVKYVLMLFNFITNSSVMVRRKIINDVGVFNINPAIIAVEDFELWLRISNIGRIYFLNNELVRYRLHAQQISGGAKSIAKSKVAIVINSKWDDMNCFQRLVYKCGTLLG